MASDGRGSLRAPETSERQKLHSNMVGLIYSSITRKILPTNELRDKYPRSIRLNGFRVRPGSMECAAVAMQHPAWIAYDIHIFYFGLQSPSQIVQYWRKNGDRVGDSCGRFLKQNTFIHDPLFFAFRREFLCECATNRVLLPHSPKYTPDDE